MADSDSGGGGGAKRNVVSSNFTSRNERGKKRDNGKGGYHNNNTRRRKEAEIPIAIAKVNLGMSPARRVVWGSVSTRLNLVGCQNQYTIRGIPRFDTITWIIAATYYLVAHEVTLAQRLGSWSEMIGLGNVQATRRILLGTLTSVRVAIQTFAPTINQRLVTPEVESLDVNRWRRDYR
jgi:hypothetical protein